MGSRPGVHLVLRPAALKMLGMFRGGLWPPCPTQPNCWLGPGADNGLLFHKSRENRNTNEKSPIIVVAGLMYSPSRGVIQLLLWFEY